MHLFARSLAGCGVVVVGATSGIGRATALLFARHGVRLMLAARDAEELHAVAAECQALGALTVATCPVDSGHHPDVERLGRAVRTELGGADVWVNTAAVLLAGDLTDCPADDIGRIITTNVLGTALLTREALAVFDERGHGTLINMSSLLGLVPNPRVPAYCMTKFAVRGLTKTLQRSRRRGSVDICLVMPGPVDTPMFATAGNHTGRELRSIPPAESPWRIAAALVRCARRPRRTVTVGLTGWGLLIGHRLLPGFVEWGVARFAGTFITRPIEAQATSGNLYKSHGPAAVGGGYRRGSRRARAGDALGRWAGTRAATKSMMQDRRLRSIGATSPMHGTSGVG